jgi:predicted DNA-binding antitoxin AbrB/MazE fold protein
MPINVTATYENGVLRPTEPLPLPERAQVRLTIVPAENWVQETAGLFGFQGSAAEAEFFAADPELDHPPPPEQP